jgi:hypothetical protein
MIAPVYLLWTLGVRGARSPLGYMAFRGRSLHFTYKHASQSVLANRGLEHILNDLQRQVKEGCVFVGLKPSAVTTFIKLSQRGVFARSAHPRIVLCRSLSGSFITLMFHVLSQWTS